MILRGIHPGALRDEGDTDRLEFLVVEDAALTTFHVDHVPSFKQGFCGGGGYWCEALAFPTRWRHRETHMRNDAREASFRNGDEAPWPT